MLSSLLSFRPLVAAQVGLSNQIPIDNLSVRTQMKDNGSLAVQQEITYLIPSNLDWIVFTNLQGLSVFADGQVITGNQLQTTSANGGRRLKSISRQARVWQLSYSTTTSLIRTNQQDRVFLKLIQASGRLVRNISVDLQLPASLTSTGLFGNVYAIQGASSSNTAVITPNQIHYQVDYAGPEAIVTINANWPKTVLRLSPWRELDLFVSNLDIGPWVFLGLALPVLSLIVLLRLLIKQRQTERPVVGIKDQLPNPISPTLVGVLVNKKIYPEEIVAMIVDLCQRGYLTIVKKSGHYFLSQRRVFDEKMANWEIKILGEIFPATNVKVSEENLKIMTREALFSPNVRDAFSQIYQIITDLHYFSENPHLTRVRYKLIGLTFYFSSGVGLIWVAVSNSSPLLLIPLVGTLLVSFLIIKLTPGLIRYTPAGQAAREEWLAFANYLADHHPVGLQESLNQTFDHYLPYAIALKKTLPWADRFDTAQRILVKPDWLVSFEQEDDSATEYAKEISRFVSSLSQLIASLRGPLVS